MTYFYISLYGLVAFFSFLFGVRQTYFRKNPYGLTPLLLPLGIFVWGDAVIIGLFWTIASVASVLLENAHLFWVIQALFWIVRSGGEILYWFLQQFASTKRDLPKTLWGSRFFPGESIWFAYQLVWQIILVLSSISLLVLLDLIAL
jgi:hypothetical protein